MSDDFSIRMNGDDGLAPPASLFAPRPDKKGPKTIAILLIMGAAIMLSIGWGDIQNSNRDDFPEEEVDTLLENFQNNDVNVSAEEYQEYHDKIRDDGAYSIRGYSLVIGGVVIIVGGVLLFRLNMLGVKMSIGGAILGLFGGFGGSWMMANASAKILPDEITMVFEIWSYLCGVCMLTCLAMAALPIINASARAALNQSVTLVSEEE